MSAPRAFATIDGDNVIRSITVLQRGDPPADTVEITEHPAWEASGGDPFSMLFRTVLATKPLRLSDLPGPRRVRVISVREFMRRFRRAEKIALETLAPSSPELRVLMRELAADDIVDLDHQDVIDGFEDGIKPALIAAGVWADEAAADARIAQIRA